jgi:hypothetical protein
VTAIGINQTLNVYLLDVDVGRSITTQVKNGKVRRLFAKNHANKVAAEVLPWLLQNAIRLIKQGIRASASGSLNATSRSKGE